MKLLILFNNKLRMGGLHGTVTLWFITLVAMYQLAFSEQWDIGAGHYEKNNYECVLHERVHWETL